MGTGGEKRGRRSREREVGEGVKEAGERRGRKEGGGKHLMRCWNGEMGE